MTVNLDTLKDKLAKELAKEGVDLGRIAELSEKLLAADPNFLRFTVDAGHIRRLGEELVGKAETALAELVKNSYDADAVSCNVSFSGASEPGGTLVIEDDGVGMTEAEIRGGWMRLSTGEKIDHPLSPIFHRSRAGRKGIGRFAVQRLGTALVLETRPSGERKGHRVTFDWEADYPQGASLSQVANKLESFAKEPDEHGTKLIIENLRDAWSEAAMGRVWRSVLLLQPPFPVALPRKRGSRVDDPGFELSINGRSEAQAKSDWSVQSAFLDYAVAIISGRIDAKGVATFTMESSALGVTETHRATEPFLALGELEFKAHYFVYDAKVVPGLAVRSMIEFGRMYGGVRVYRNGFRVQPYGEPHDDWLKLAFDTARRTLLIPANNFNFFGQVTLDVDRNLLLEETSGREGLIENEAFAELQTFVRMGLEWGAKRVGSLRERKVDPRVKRRKTGNDGRPSAAMASLISRAATLAKDSGDERAADLVDDLERVKDAQEAFEKETDEEREATARYEEMLRILASLGMSIAVFGHEIGGALTIVAAEIQRLKLESQNAKADRLDFASAEAAVVRLGDLGRYIVDVMSNAESRQLVNVALHAAITRFVTQFSTYLDKQGVAFETHVAPQYLRTIPIHRSEVDAVLFNLMTNALKAIRRANQHNGRIKVSAARLDNMVVLSVQDNGTGIPEELHDRIFEAFYSTTDYAPDDVAGTGSGLGLKIISDIADVYGGWVKVGQPEAGFEARIDFAVPVAEGQI